MAKKIGEAGALKFLEDKEAQTKKNTTINTEDATVKNEALSPLDFLRQKEAVAKERLETSFGIANFRSAVDNLGGDMSRMEATTDAAVAANMASTRRLNPNYLNTLVEDITSAISVDPEKDLAHRKPYLLKKLTGEDKWDDLSIIKGIIDGAKPFEDRSYTELDPNDIPDPTAMGMGVSPSMTFGGGERAYKTNDYQPYLSGIASDVMATLPINRRGNYVIRGREYTPIELKEGLKEAVRINKHDYLLRNSTRYRDDVWKAATGKTYAEWYQDVIINQYVPRIKELRDKASNEAYWDVKSTTKDIMRSSGLVSGLLAEPTARVSALLAEKHTKQTFDDILEKIYSYKDNNFTAGFNESFDLVNMLTMGISGLSAEYQKGQIFSKMKSGEELDSISESIYELMMMEDEINRVGEDVFGELSLAQKVGSATGMTAEIAPTFFVGMSAVGNIGKFANVSLKGAFSNGIGRGLLNTTKVGGKLAYNLALAETRGLTAAAVDPHTWERYNEKRNQQYTWENGKLIYTPTPEWEDVYASLVEQANEYASEFAGGGISALLRNGARSLGRLTRLEKLTRGYKPSPWMRTTMRNLGNTGVISEPTSEVLGDIMTNVMLMPLGKQDWSMLEDKEYFLTVFLSTALYGGALNIPVGAIDNARQKRSLTEKKNTAFNHIENASLANALQAASQDGYTEASAQELAGLPWREYRNSDIAFAMDYIAADYALQMRKGEIAENARMQEFIGVAEGLASRAYRGVNGDEQTEQIYVGETEDGTKYTIISGDIDGEGTGIVICKDANDNETPMALAKLTNISMMTVEDGTLRAYVDMFGTQVKMEQLREVKQTLNNMGNVTEQDAARLMRMNGFEVRSTGESVTLVDGSTATIDSYADNGYYYVTKEDGVTLYVPFYDILSADAGIAEAQGLVYAEGITAAMSEELETEEIVETTKDLSESLPAADTTSTQPYTLGDIITTKTGEKARILFIHENGDVEVDYNLENTSSYIDDIQHGVIKQEDIVSDTSTDATTEQASVGEHTATTNMPEQAATEAPSNIVAEATEMVEIPKQEDGSIDFNAITDPKVYAEQFVLAMGNREVAAEQMTKMAAAAQAEMEQLSKKNEALSDANEIVRNRKAMDNLAQKISFYGEVLGEIMPEDKPSEAETTPTAEAVEQQTPESQPTESAAGPDSSTPRIETAQESTSTGVVNDENAMAVADNMRNMIDALAKRLGLSVRFAPRVGGYNRDSEWVEANGTIEGTNVTISTSKYSRAIGFIVGHEFTHRMQTLAPKEYAELKKVIREELGEETWRERTERMSSLYESRNMKYDDALIEDEVVADYVGDMVENTNLFHDFVNKNKERGGVLAAIRRVLADILRRIKGVLPATKARSLSNVVKQIDTLLEAASAAQEQATRASNANSGKPQYSLTDEQASAIIETMKANAEVAPQVELTPENWVAEFGVDGVVTTPIGEVKMGERQYEKMQQRGRNTKLGMVKPTLNSPDIIIEEYSKRNDGKVAERNSSFVYIKAFTNADGTRDYMFTSVSNQRNGIEIIVSNQEKETPRVKRLLKEGRLAYISKATLPSEFTASAQGDQSTIPSEVSSFNNKDTTSSPNMQEEGVKFSLQQLDADYLSAVERGDMETAQRMVLEAAKLAMPDTKIVDENGFPKVVYHQTNATEYVNVETGERWDDLDWMKRAEWDERDDWDEYWQEREFYTFSRANARTTQEFDGFFFAPEYDEYHEYGDRTISAFLNIKNPASRTDYNIDSSKNNAGREERLRLQQEGYDGVIREENGVVWEYVAFEPNQIKSADPVTYDDNGNVIPLLERFNPEKEDIRYSLGQPTDEDVTFDNFFERTSAIFTQITDTPTTKPDYISRSGSTYWYGEDERGKYVIRRSDHWSAIVRDEEDAEAFNAKPDDFNNIASCYWALDMRTYKPQSFAPINKETVRSINYNSGSKDLNIVFNDGKTTRRRGVEPRDMRKYFELRNSGDMSAANGYVVDMVNELYLAAPMPTVQTAKAYLDEFTKWSGESEQKSEQKRKLYSVQDQPTFYSNAEYAVRGIKQEKATPEQWLKMVEKSGGLKAGEDKWLGLSDWLKASDKKTLTKDEVLQYIAENNIQVEEVEYAQFGPGLINEATRKLEAEMREIGIVAMREKYDGFDDLFEVYNDELVWSENMASEGEYEDFIIDNNIVDVNAQANAINETRINYTTNGLTNKREIALIVPTIEPWNTSDNIHFGDAGEGRAVAWVRFGETTDAEGKRVLVIDEIQSKRHQEGREKGYSDKRVSQQELYDAQEEAFSRIIDYESALADKYGEDEWAALASEEEMAEYERLRAIDEAATNAYENYDKGIPSAPFEKNWAELAMKRMLRYAAENGYDYVAWTTGDQQSKRYNMLKVVSKIYRRDNSLVDGKRFLLVGDTVVPHKITINDDGIIISSTIENIEGKPLSEVMGKEVALKMMQMGNESSLEDVDLHIGGESMKAFYDQILPSFVRKYAKKWGATVGEVTMPDLEENNTMHSVDVTPAMRESVMQGQSKFSLIGELGAANLDKAEEATKRLDNLAVARNMETAGKDAKTIKLATGWERGADGKWRYEIDDAVINQNAIFNHRDDGVSITLLGELLTGGELLKAYPQLDDMVVVYQELPLGTLGGYSPANKLGMPANIVLSDMFLSRRENPEWRAEVERMEQEPIIKAWSDAMTAEPHDNNAYESAEQAFKASPLWEEYNNLLMGKGKYPRLIKGIGGREALLHEVQHAIQDIEGFAMGGNTKSEGYNRLAGEVEARNVEKRANMTTQERLASLAEETEDVARKDQIILREGTKMAMGAKKKSAEETASPNNSDHSTAISSADGAKILKNLDNLAKKYQEKSNRPKTFIGDVSNALGILMPNKSSKYGTFKVKSGDVVTIRLSNHNATASNLDAMGEDDAISIVVANKPDNGIVNDGDAHIVEFYYNSRTLGKADGKPLVDIIFSIKQALYSGVYIDKTGLAKRAEINPRYSISESYAPFSTTEAGEIAKQMRADGALPSEIYARTGWWWDAKGRMRNYPRDKQPRAAKIVELQKAEGTYDERTSFGNIEAENVGKQGLGSTTEEQVRLWLKNRHLVAIDNIRKKYKMYRDTARLDLQEKQRLRREHLDNLRTTSAKIDYILGDVDETALSYYDQALVKIARGGVSIVWEDSADGKRKGLASETGAKKGEKNLYRGITDGATQYFDEAVHSWWESLDGYANDIDTQDLRNALIEALKEASNSHRALILLRDRYDRDEANYDATISTYEHGMEEEIREEDQRYEVELADFEKDKEAQIRSFEGNVSYFESVGAMAGAISDIRKRLDQVKHKASKRIEREKRDYKERREAIAEIKQQIKNTISAQSISVFQRNELRRLLDKVDKARSLNEVSGISVEIENILLDTRIRHQRKDVSKMLKMRLPEGISVETWLHDKVTAGVMSAADAQGVMRNLWSGTNASGVNVAKWIDGETAITLKYLSSLIGPTMKSVLIEEEDVAERGTKVRLDPELKIDVPKIVESNEARISELIKRKAQAEQFTDEDNAELCARYIYDSYLQSVSAKQNVEKTRRIIDNVYTDYYATPNEYEALYYAAVLREELIEDKQHYVEALAKLSEELLRLLKEGRNKLSEFRQQQEEHKMEVLRMGWKALSVDTRNVPMKPTAWERVRAGARVLNDSYWTFQTALKEIDHHAPNGEGAFYWYFMDGWATAANSLVDKQCDHNRRIAEKLGAIFQKKAGKKSAEFIAKFITDSDSVLIGDFRYIKRVRPDGTAEYEDVPMTYGNAMYILAMWRQTQYRNSFIKYGVTQEQIDQIYDSLPTEYITFMNWVNEVLLPDTRLEYNETHKQMFGVGMAEERNYFPGRVLGFREDVDLGSDNLGALPSTITGAIITRQKNSNMPDVRQNYFKVLMNHLQEMDQWSSFAPVIRDLNTLLSDNTFKQMCNTYMPGVKNDRGGTGSLFGKFKTLSAIAANCYRPQHSTLDDVALAVSKGWAGSNISWRFWTAAKQMASSPVFLFYAGDPFHRDGLRMRTIYAKNLATFARHPKTSFKWCIDNSPSFRQRWESKFAGNEFLAAKIREEDGTSHYNKFRNSRVGKVATGFDEAIRKIAVDYGMTPNAAVDAATVALGIKCVYEFELERMMQRDGNTTPTKEQQRKAMIRAEIAFNTSQQSSEGAYMSEMQMTRTFFVKPLTIYMNSTFGFHRLRIQGVQELAKQIFSKEYKRAILREYGDEAPAVLAAARHKAMGHLLMGVSGDTLFQLMGYIPLWILASASDDDDKREALKSALLSSLVNCTVGSFAFGMPLSSMLNGYGFSLNPGINDLEDDIKKFGKVDWFSGAGMLTALNIVSRYGYGCDIKTFANIAKGIDGIIEGSGTVEGALKILNAPQSQINIIAGARREGETAREYVTRRMRIETLFSMPEYDEVFDEDGRFIGEDEFTSPYGMAKYIAKDLYNDYEIAYRNDVVYRLGGKEMLNELRDVEESYTEVVEAMGWKVDAKPNKKAVQNGYVAPIKGLSEDNYWELWDLANVAALDAKDVLREVGTDSSYYEAITRMLKSKKQLISKYNELN